MRKLNYILVSFVVVLISFAVVKGQKNVRLSEQRKFEESIRADSLKAAEEAERIAKEAYVNSFRDSLQIISVRSSDPNSAGGVGTYIAFRNKSSRTIKYVHFGVIPYNRVGDEVKCTIDNRSFNVLEVVGPIKKNGFDEGYWENIWWNSTIVKAKIKTINIEFMDGEEISFFLETK